MPGCRVVVVVARWAATWHSGGGGMWGRDVVSSCYEGQCGGGDGGTRMARGRHRDATSRCHRGKEEILPGRAPECLVDPSGVGMRTLDE